MKIEFIDKVVNKTKSTIEEIRGKIRVSLRQITTDYLKNSTVDEKSGTKAQDKSQEEANSVTPQDANKETKTKHIREKATPKDIPLKKQKHPDATYKDVLKIVTKYDKGIKQTELYKELNKYDSQKISSLLSQMDKDNQIRREKIGTSYIVFEMKSE